MEITYITKYRVYVIINNMCGYLCVCMMFRFLLSWSSLDSPWKSCSENTSSPIDLRACLKLWSYLNKVGRNSALCMTALTRFVFWTVQNGEKQLTILHASKHSFSALNWWGIWLLWIPIALISLYCHTTV